MKSRWNLPVFLWSVAGVALVTGLLWTMANIIAFPQERRWINSKVGDLREIETISSSMRDLESALATLETIPDKDLKELSYIADSAGVSPEIDYEEDEPLLERWAIKNARVEFEETEIAKAMEFIVAAERQRPPWRTTSCQIRALPDTSGSVRAILSLEGVKQ